MYCSNARCDFQYAIIQRGINETCDLVGFSRLRGRDNRMAAAQTAVKIGVLADMSGPYSDFAGQVQSKVKWRWRISASPINPLRSKSFRRRANKPDIATRLRGAGSTPRRRIRAVIDIPTSGIACRRGHRHEKNKVKDRNDCGHFRSFRKGLHTEQSSLTWDTWSTTRYRRGGREER
jgi:hypothetical protein